MEIPWFTLSNLKKTKTVPSDGKVVCGTDDILMVDYIQNGQKIYDTYNVSLMRQLGGTINASAVET